MQAAHGRVDDDARGGVISYAAAARAAPMMFRASLDFSGISRYVAALDKWPHAIPTKKADIAFDGLLL